MEIILVLFALFTSSLMTSQTIDVCSSSYPGGAICQCTTTTYNCVARNISKLPSGFNNSATTLDLSNNKITSVHVGPLNNLTNLMSLYLEGNLIETIEVGSFDGLMNLRKLELRVNQLRTIGRGVFRQLPSLEELHLEVNLIETIEAGSFDGMMNLRLLFLQFNKLRTIRRDIFRHLSSLEKLDLSNNTITSINRYAFFTIPSLTKINLDNNPLNCSCEEYLLQEFLKMRKDGPSLTNKPCKAGQTPCPSGETLFDSTISCYKCQYAASFPDCGKQSGTKCTVKNSVCYNQIDYSSGDLNISGGCKDFKSCLYEEENNENTCYVGAGTKCLFCNPSSLSNARDDTNTTKTFYAVLLVTLKAQMTEQLQNTSSSVYENFTKTLETEVSKHMRGQKGRFDVEFLDLRSPFVTLSFRVRCTTMWFNSADEVMAAVGKSLSHKTINGKNVTSVQSLQDEGDVPCPAETTEDSTYGNFTWPITDPGASKDIECPYQLYNNRIAKYASRNCKRQSDNSGLWEQPLLSNCPHVDEKSRELQTLAESDVNEGNVEEVSTKLSTLTSNWQSFGSAQITWSIDIICHISNLTHVSPKPISTTFETVNKLLFTKFDILHQAEIESKSSNRLVKGIQLLLDGVSVSGSDYQAVKENIAGIASAVSASSFEGLTMSYRHPGTKTLTNTKIKYRKEDGAIEKDHSGIVLPKVMFDTLSEEERKSIDKITLLVLKDPKLFSSITQTNETKFIQNDDGDTIPAERKVNSHIIGASVPAAAVKDLQTPVVVTLSHLFVGKNVSCVYWNVDNSSWSEEGCSVKKTTDDYTVCHCNHLTNFALLMDVYSTGASSLALSVISYVGCGLSLVGVLLTLITHLKFRKLRRGNPSKILMNLCLSIGLVDIVFLVGVQEYSGNSDSGCKVVAILLHYFLLTSMCWMAVEAFYMYLALVKVFDSHVSHFQLKSSLFGWCTPLLVIAITLGINKSENYGLQPGGICWLDRVPFFAAFLAPVCLLLLVNTIIFLLVIRRILNRGTKKMTKSDKSTTVVRLRGAVSVFVLLGLTWVFGVLAFDGVDEAFHYIFALLNSSQGFFIFIFYCVLKKEAQQSWRQVLPCLKSPYEKATSSTTQNKGDSSAVYSSKTTTFYVSSKDDSSTVGARKATNLRLNENTSQISKAVENECKSNTGDSSTIDPNNTTKQLDVISKESISQDSKSLKEGHKNCTGDSSTIDQSNNTKLDVISKESISQDSKSLEEEHKNCTGDSSTIDQSNNTKLDVISKENISRDSKSVDEERKNSTESADQVSSSVADESIINTECTSKVSNSIEEEAKNNTAFRGNWHVQVRSPTQKISFV